MAAITPRSSAWIATALTIVAAAAQPAWAEDPASAKPSPAAAASAPAAGSVSLLASATAAAQTASQNTQPAAAPAPEPEDAKLPVTGGITADFMSHYVWRGFLLTDSFAFQPTAWAKFGDVTFSSWSSWSDVDGGPAMEHDFTIDYTKAVHPKVNLSVGYINYFFPAVDAGRHSDELYVVSAFVAPLNPTVKAYFDVHEGKGTYLNFGVSHPIPLGSKVTATPSFAIGYNMKQWIEDNTWNDANFGLKLTIPVHAKVTLAPGIYYSKGLTENYDDLIPDKFYGGLSVAVTF